MLGKMVPYLLALCGRIYRDAACGISASVFPGGAFCCLLSMACKRTQAGVLQNAPTAECCRPCVIGVQARAEAKFTWIMPSAADNM